MSERGSMLDQYRKIKALHRDALLFFRLGDFYEMFASDAIEASALLGLTLTKRQDQPMCGVPYHAAKTYISRLLKAGKKVAICEQLGTPGPRGIVDRDVIEVVTPGTTVEDEFLDRSASNYLAGVCRMEGRVCMASLEVSTGDFRAYSEASSPEGDLEFFRSELHRLSPRELIVQQSLYEDSDFLTLMREFEGTFIERRPDWSFDREKAREELLRRFGLGTLKGFGFSGEAPELAVAGVLISYLDENSKRASPHIGALLPFDRKAYVALDEATRRNLELVRNLSDSGKRDTLLSVLDRTRTNGGSRLLSQWILQPLKDMEAIGARLDGVEFLYRDQLLLNETRRRLASVLDSERLVARLAMDKAHAKDLLALGVSVDASLGIASMLGKAGSPPPPSGMVKEEDRATAREIVVLLASAIRDDPSILLTEGNMIREGFDPELDSLRHLKKDATSILEAYLEEEKLRSGIQNLRIRYNRIIGYYLEVTKGKLDSVPGHFIRRQSLVTGERYTTQRLAELEGELNGATERIIEREKILFLDLRERLKPSIQSLKRIARYIAEVDCLASFAQAATEGGYSRPVVTEKPVLDIRKGRHPVVESCIPLGSFVPNDLFLDADGVSFALVTGPNMAGKSTVLRQTALITLMAHAGSFVPAEQATIGLADKIFCRVGAQDNLARGESTFLVEMHETAYILNTATSRSLVIMDEVGRGTGTLDGVSIAWAVSEHLLGQLKCRTLFATHYHELTSLEHERLRNLSMAVLESEGAIVFLKQLVEGPAAGSYGLHVARLAGVPDTVLARARELQRELADFEKSLSENSSGILRGGGAGAGAGSAAGGAGGGSGGGSVQAGRAVELFSPEDLVISRLKGTDPDRMTPLEALSLLSELVGELEDKRDSVRRRT